MNKQDQRENLTLKQLDAHLFKCADIIRNTVDKTDYKDYILPLVFYKALSDTYQDQFEEKLEEYGDEEIARLSTFYDFVIPEGYQWENLRKRSKNIDEFINEAFSGIEEENPDKLDGVFRADYVAADGLTDDRLATLVEHLSKHNLSVRRVPPDMLGEAYMDLVRHFAQEEGRDGGEYFTPPHIVRLLVEILAPFEDGDRFHDPTCGSGGMLVEAARYYREEQKGDPSRLTFSGQEINPDICAIAKMNLFLHNLAGEIRRGDSLMEPRFTENGNLERFDYILANFPFSADWPKEHLQDDPWSRFEWAAKLPRADRGDYAFVMHMAAQLKDTGQAAILIPHGVLHRKYEKRYRRFLVENDIVEAVVALPPNLFQNNSIPCAVLVLNKSKHPGARGGIQFVYASDTDFYREKRNQNELTDDGIDRIVESIKNRKGEEGVSRYVVADEIRRQEYNLNIPLYIDTVPAVPTISVGSELVSVRRLSEKREEIEEWLFKQLQALGYPSISSKNHNLRSTNPDGWTTERLRDLLIYDTPGTWGEDPSDDERVPVLRATNFSELGIVLDDVATRSLSDSQKSAKRLQPGDLIVERSGGSADQPVGRVLFFDLAGEYYPGNFLQLIRPDQAEINCRFLHFALWDFYRRGGTVPIQTFTTSIRNLQYTTYRNINVPVPPLEEQRKIASILYMVDELCKVYRSDLKGLKEGLLQDLLTGRVRTQDTDIEVIDEVGAYG